MGATEAFYTGVLGLTVGPRPHFQTPRNRPIESASYAGSIDRVAFVDAAIAGMCERFRAAGVAFRDRLVPTLNLEQVFVEEPNGMMIKLSFSM